MGEPRIDLIPLKPAVRSDSATTLDVLVRITPPAPEVHFVRPPINLGLAIDRSGSMAGARKMDFAIQAACFAVEQLLPTDRVGVTIFDTEVETIVPNAPATDKPAILKRIKQIVERGATNLYGGYVEAGRQVKAGHLSGGLNRIILLSDGLANEGVTDPNALADAAKGFLAPGVSTTTMGLGDDYNEDLMQAMGRAGGGNYYYIESPTQLVDIFQTELQGLMANLGSKVSLGLEPVGEAKVGEVLNKLDRNELGRLKLADLVVGIPISVLVRLTVPPAQGPVDVCKFRLAWDDLRSGGRTSRYAMLTLPATDAEGWDDLPSHPEVAEQVALVMAARAKEEAVLAFDAEDYEGTRAGVDQAHAYLMMMPPSPLIAREIEEIDQLKADLDANNGAKFRKRTTAQVYRRQRGHES